MCKICDYIRDREDMEERKRQEARKHQESKRECQNCVYSYDPYIIGGCNQGDCCLNKDRKYIDLSQAACEHFKNKYIVCTQRR